MTDEGQHAVPISDGVVHVGMQALPEAHSFLGNVYFGVNAPPEANSILGQYRAVGGGDRRGHRQQASLASNGSASSYTPPQMHRRQSSADSIDLDSNESGSFKRCSEDGQLDQEMDSVLELAGESGSSKRRRAMRQEARARAPPGWSVLEEEFSNATSIVGSSEASTSFGGSSCHSAISSCHAGGVLASVLSRAGASPDANLDAVHSNSVSLSGHSGATYSMRASESEGDDSGSHSVLSSPLHPSSLQEGSRDRSMDRSPALDDSTHAADRTAVRPSSPDQLELEVFVNDMLRGPSPPSPPPGPPHARLDSSQKSQQ